MGRALKTLVLAAIVASAGAGWAFLRPAGSAHACGAAGPFDFDMYEAEDYIGTYSTAIELATAGKAVTFSYNLSSTGEPIDFTYQGLLKGPRAARTATLDTSVRVPPSIYKSIVWIESSWANGSTVVPYGGVGPILRSFDCGYGLGQITSGMTDDTGNASARQALIGTDFVFNLAEGVRILADKWNAAPKYRPIAGTGDPANVEDWYFAIWSYNGFAFKNHPLNPELDPLRGGSAASPIYHCYNPSAPSFQDAGGGTPKFGYGDYTYQERVYGCMAYPPKYTPPAGGAKTVMWQPQPANMPDFNNPVVAAAFAPENFTACQDAGFSGGCANMDFPTAFPADPDKGTAEVKPHQDATPIPGAAKAAALLGDPRLSYSGPNALSLTANPDGTATSGSVTVTNAGTWIAPFRVRTSAPWIVVRHPGDPASRTLDGGVAIGAATDVVTQAPNATRPRVAQKGYQSVLTITVNPGLMPPGTSKGTVWIEPLLGGGGVFQVDVLGMNGANRYPYRAVAPALATEH